MSLFIYIYIYTYIWVYVGMFLLFARWVSLIIKNIYAYPHTYIYFKAHTHSPVMMSRAHT